MHGAARGAVRRGGGRRGGGGTAARGPPARRRRRRELERDGQLRGKQSRQVRRDPGDDRVPGREGGARGRGEVPVLEELVPPAAAASLSPSGGRAEGERARRRRRGQERGGGRGGGGGGDSVERLRASVPKPPSDCPVDHKGELDVAPRALPGLRHGAGERGSGSRRRRGGRARGAQAGGGGGGRGWRGAPPPADEDTHERHRVPGRGAAREIVEQQQRQRAPRGRGGGGGGGIGGCSAPASPSTTSPPAAAAASAPSAGDRGALGEESLLEVRVRGRLGFVKRDPQGARGRLAPPATAKAKAAAASPSSSPPSPATSAAAAAAAAAAVFPAPLAGRGRRGGAPRRQVGAAPHPIPALGALEGALGLERDDASRACDRSADRYEGAGVLGTEPGEREGGAREGAAGLCRRRRRRTRSRRAATASSVASRRQQGQQRRRRGQQPHGRPRLDRHAEALREVAVSSSRRGRGQGLGDGGLLRGKQGVVQRVDPLRGPPEQGRRGPGAGSGYVEQGDGKAVGGLHARLGDEGADVLCCFEFFVCGRGGGRRGESEAGVSSTTSRKFARPNLVLQTGRALRPRVRK